MRKFCLSCGLPISEETAANINSDYCNYCSDDNGNLLPKEVVLQGVAKWLEEFAPVKDNIDFIKRAGFYMKSMPAWADK